LKQKHEILEFLDFRGAVNRVLKKWYEQRIEEETEKNRKLRQLHDNLTRIKVLKEEEAMQEREA
jgi:ABC-type bacteriocin/lantibiotic exporter with double-glycine peptidase domain